MTSLARQRVLDFGCGDSALSCQYAERASLVIGMDRDLSHVHLAVGESQQARENLWSEEGQRLRSQRGVDVEIVFTGAMLTSFLLSPVGGAPVLTFCPLHIWGGVSKPSFWTPPHSLLSHLCTSEVIFEGRELSHPIWKRDSPHRDYNGGESSLLDYKNEYYSIGRL